MTGFVIMKFVVTGGAGFIGSYIVKHLVQCEHQVSVIDNFFRGKNENLDEVKNNITIFDTDILNFEEIKNFAHRVMATEDIREAEKRQFDGVITDHLEDL